MKLARSTDCTSRRQEPADVFKELSVLIRERNRDMKSKDADMDFGGTVTIKIARDLFPG